MVCISFLLLLYLYMNSRVSVAVVMLLLYQSMHYMLIGNNYCAGIVPIYIIDGI